MGYYVVHPCPHAAPLIHGFYRQKVKKDSRAQKATDRGTKLHPTLPWPSGLLSGGQGFPRAFGPRGALTSLKGPSGFGGREGNNHSEMLRTVASPGTFGCHDRLFFYRCTEVTDKKADTHYDLWFTVPTRLSRFCASGEKEPHLIALAGSRAREARAATAFCGGKARDPFIMHTDYASMGGKKFFTPLFLPYIRSTLEVHFFDFILGRATPSRYFFFVRIRYFICCICWFDNRGNSCAECGPMCLLVCKFVHCSLPSLEVGCGYEGFCAHWCSCLPRLQF